MNAHRISAEEILKLRIKNALRVQKLAVVRDQGHSTARHIGDQDAPGDAFCGPDVPELPRTVAVPPDRLSPSGREVDNVDLAAFDESETVVGQEKPGHDGT